MRFILEKNFLHPTLTGNLKELAPPYNYKKPHVLQWRNIYVYIHIVFSCEVFFPEELKNVYVYMYIGFFCDVSFSKEGMYMYIYTVDEVERFLL